MFLDNVNQEECQNNEKITDIKFWVVFMLLICLCFLINALKYEKFNLDSYLNGKTANINIQIMKNCDCKRTPIFLKCSKVPLVFSPLSVIPTDVSSLPKEQGGGKNNYYCLYNDLKAFIATLWGPLSILLLFWGLFGGTLAFVLDLQERPTQILYMQLNFQNIRWVVSPLTKAFLQLSSTL